MSHPLRLRLALWHAFSLATLLVAFSVATYSYFARSSLKTLDREISESIAAFQADAFGEPEEEGGLAHIAESVTDFQTSAQISVFEASGRLLGTSPSNRLIGSPPPALIDSLAKAPPGVRSTAGFRIRSIRQATPEFNGVIIASRSLHERDEALHNMLLAFVVGISIAVVLAGLAGLELAGRSIRPVIEANEQQRRFMADAAHELRTPVSVLRAETDVALSRDRSADEYRTSLRLLHDETVRLSGIVDDLFLLARVDAGHVPLRREPVDLVQLVRESERAMAALAGQRTIDLKIEIKQQPAVVTGDNALLRRLLLNLLDNAIKYSERNARLSIALRETSGSYEIAVHNSGKPIDPDLRERIFERFFRAVDAASEPSSGAGLGLSIARWVASAHGGTLQLTRNGADGNQFTFSMPRDHL